MTKKSEKTSLEKVMIIIGYIAVGVAVYFLIGFLFQSSSDTSNDKEGRVRNLISDKYEVMSVGLYDYGTINRSIAYVEMVSFGNRNDQVFEGISALEIIYENASKYLVTIFEEKQKCFYGIEGAINLTKRINLIDYQIEEIEYCH